jgi:asparagine synthase (glutamine-hydrolysing)
MFAIAIYDSSQNRLILARDRVGKKPLYYAEQSGVVYFASDIKAVSYTLPQEPSVDLEALDCYLHHICVPDEHSIFKNIQKFNRNFSNITPGRRTSFTYWEWNFNTKDNATEEEFLSQCEKLLQKAVLRRIVSDVPLGVMLSGGVDSSIITAILARNLPGRVKTLLLARTTIRSATYSPPGASPNNTILNTTNLSSILKLPTFYWS